MGAIPRPLSGRQMKVQAPHSLLATRPASIHGRGGVACQCAFVLCGAEATSMLLWLAAGAAVNLRSCCVGSASGFTPGLLFSGYATKGVPAPLELQSRPVHRCGMEERVWGRGAGGGAVPALDGRLEYRQAHETLARTGGDGASGRGRCRAAAGIGRSARRSCAEGPARRQFRRGLVVCALHETPSFDRNAVQRRRS